MNSSRWLAAEGRVEAVSHSQQVPMATSAGGAGVGEASSGTSVSRAVVGGCRLCSHLNCAAAGTFTMCEVRMRPCICNHPPPRLIVTMLIVFVAKVNRHKSALSAWVVAHGHVYDATAFLNQHPAGNILRLQSTIFPPC